MASVSIKKLTKTYADKSQSEITVVKGVDLEIRDREFMVLVGPSGCGKSTTLRMIAGLETITSGEVQIGDQVVNELPPKDRDIAMVFQNYALYPHMTVRENMGFGLKMRKYPKEEITQRVNEAAAMLGLESYLDRRPKALSGGQRQRVAVGRAIVRKPKVFLFDEPLSNLDAKMRVSTRAEISRLHDKLEATMIYVTHDQTEAMTMGDRICVMKDGKIMQVDEPLALYNNPDNLFVAGFIGSPPMNFFHGQLKDQDGLLCFQEDGTEVSFMLNQKLSDLGKSYIGKPIVLGIRPENISLSESASDNHVMISSTLEVAEPMGAETYQHLHTGKTRFVARVSPTGRHEAGSTIRVSLDLGKVHLFDAQTELVIR